MNWPLDSHNCSETTLKLKKAQRKLLHSLNIIAHWRNNSLNIATVCNVHDHSFHCSWWTLVCYGLYIWEVDLFDKLLSTTLTCYSRPHWQVTLDHFDKLLWTTLTSYSGPLWQITLYPFDKLLWTTLTSTLDHFDKLLWTTLWQVTQPACGRLNPCEVAQRPTHVDWVTFFILVTK